MYTLKLESSSQPSNLGSSGVLRPVLPRSADAKKDHRKRVFYLHEFVGCYLFEAAGDRLSITATDL